MGFEFGIGPALFIVERIFLMHGAAHLGGLLKGFDDQGDDVQDRTPARPSAAWRSQNEAFT